MSTLGQFRLPIQRTDQGLIRPIAGATVSIYLTNADGTSPVSTDGSVTPGAVLATLYRERTGILGLANPLIADTQGLVSCFMASGTYHFAVVAPDGQKFGVPWISHWGDPSTIVVGETSINAKDYPTIQAAIDASPGGPVHIPIIGTLTPSTRPAFTSILLPKDKPINLKGYNKKLTVLNNPGDVNADLVDVRGDYSSIEDLTIRGPGSVGAGRGIVIGRPAVDSIGTPLLRLFLKDVWVDLTAASGIYLRGYNEAGNDANSISILSRADGVDVTTNKAGALLFTQYGNTTWGFRDCSFRRAIGNNILLGQISGFSFLGGSIEEPLSDVDTGPWVLISTCSTVSFRDTWLECTGLSVQTQFAFRLNNGNNRGMVFDNVQLARAHGGAIHDTNFMIIGGNGGDDGDITIINPLLYVDNPASQNPDITIGANCTGPIHILGGRVVGQRGLIVSDASGRAGFATGPLAY